MSWAVGPFECVVENSVVLDSDSDIGKLPFTAPVLVPKASSEGRNRLGTEVTCRDVTGQIYYACGRSRS